LGESTEPRGPESRSGAIKQKYVMDQRFLLTAVLATIIVILAVVATAVLYGLDVSRAPRTAAERAVATSEAATREQPKVAENWVDLTYAYVAAGRFSDARQASARGKKVENLPEFYIADAYMLEQQGETDEALEAYDLAKQQATAEFDARVKAAAEKGARLSALNYGLADAAIFKGRLLAEQGETASALKEFDLALEIDPQMSDVLVERADLKVTLGDSDGARADYTEALRFVPDMPEALQGLERVGAAQ